MFSSSSFSSVGSDDQEVICPTIGIVSTISDLLVSSLLSINLAMSLAKQGFKTLLVDLDLSQPTMGLLLPKIFFKFSTNNLFEKDVDLEQIEKEIYTKSFNSKGSISIIPASMDIRSRLKVQDATTTDLKSNLVRLMEFINFYKTHFNFIIINMPNGSDLKQLSQACLVSDNNFLLIDQSSIAISYGLDLIANLESIHPLIEFKGLILYDYSFNVNFIEDDRPLLEQTFNLPIIATLPELPDESIINYGFKEDFRLLNYYKVFSQELYRFIHKPHQFVPNSTKSEIIEVLILANNAGIPLFTSYFRQNNSENDKSTILRQDEILASATLTAVVTGITEVIKEITMNLSGETKLIKQKHLNLVIEYDSPLRAMMLTQRSEEAVRGKIILFMNLFKTKYKSEIESFIGLSKSFTEAQALVEEVF